MARVEDGRLILERRADAIHRLQDRFAGIGSGVNLADELIAERRAEVERER